MKKMIFAAALVVAGVVVRNAPTAAADSGLTALVDAAAQRLQTADAVAAVKFRDGGSVEDPQREQQVIDAVTTAASEQHVDPAFVHNVFRDQIDATVGVEHSLLGRWKLDPATVPVGAPDLAQSRTAIDALNHTMVDEIARSWPILQSDRCQRMRDDALDAVATSRGLDALYRQALQYATRSYCG